MKKTYDSTVARIAGNIASGYISRYGEPDSQEQMVKVANNCVAIARHIVAATERTEPKAEL